METTNDFLADIIDLFEDFLDNKGVHIPNEERDRDNPEHYPSHVYGSDYDVMMSELRGICEAHGIVVKDEWNN